MTITIFLAIVAVVATGAATYYKGVADTYRHARFDIHIHPPAAFETSVSGHKER